LKQYSCYGTGLNEVAKHICSFGKWPVNSEQDSFPIHDHIIGHWVIAPIVTHYSNPTIRFLPFDKVISRSRTSSSNPSPPIHQRFAWSVQPPPTVQESRFLYSTVPTRIRTTQRCGVAGAPEITTSNRANPPSWPPGFKAIRPRIPPIQQPPREKNSGYLNAFIRNREELEC